jgi:transposase
MIPVPSGGQVWLATGFTDMRKGFDGLAALVQDHLRRDPFCGQAFVFRGRQGRLIKVLWWDGQGLCLFAKRSEKIERTVEQLELAIEALEEDDAQRIAVVPAVADVVEAAFEHSTKPARRALPEHLPREEIVHPGACACPQCGGVLRKIGADVTETLDYLPGRFKGRSACAGGLLLPGLRDSVAGTGATSSDCARASGRRIAGAHHGFQVR